MQNYLPPNEETQEFIGNRFAACMLHLAELKMVHTDGKPQNYLVQKRYSVEGEPGRPACVLATDFDARFVLVSSLQQSDELNV